MVLAPGNRVELLVKTREAYATLTAAPVNRGSMSPMMGDPAIGRGGPAGEGTLDICSLESGWHSMTSPAAPFSIAESSITKTKA